jgi:hypothetical protein
MGKASIAIAVRATRAEHAPHRMSHAGAHKESLGFSYLKLATLLAMVFLPWVGIIYIVRVALTGH